MPGYGIRRPDEGTGLLSWSWAEERLASAKNYWVATSWPDGRPHAMPVWGVWDDDAVWFSSSARSRKVRNIAGDPRCVVTTEDAWEPVVVEGQAEIVREPGALERFIGLVNEKYDTEYGTDFLDPEVNATIQVTPSWVFALTEDDFTGSPTRWQFD
jgi:PPOX class probable F420-dependent enzyme